jgi:hypothetical protein
LKANISYPRADNRFNTLCDAEKISRCREKERVSLTAREQAEGVSIDLASSFARTPKNIFRGIFGGVLSIEIERRV